MTWKPYPGEPTNVALTRILTALAVITSCPTAFASGFVKDAGDHYTKLNLSVQPRQSYGTGTEAFREDVREVSLYSELGLPLPWRSQVSLYVPWTMVTRTAATLGDKFESASFADLRVGLKLDLGSRSFFAESSLPLTVYLATDSGIVLPTTSSSYREGNESSRYGDAPQGASFLVASIDRGISRWTQGLGLSVVGGPVWLSGRFALSQDVRPKSPESSVGLDLGLGLPWNSWVQMGWERIAALAAEEESKDSATGKERPPPLRLETKLKGSLGLTVWDGLALELGYTQNRTQTGSLSPITSMWLVGLSYRSL